MASSSKRETKGFEIQTRDIPPKRALGVVIFWNNTLESDMHIQNAARGRTRVVL